MTEPNMPPQHEKIKQIHQNKNSKRCPSPREPANRNHTNPHTELDTCTESMESTATPQTFLTQLASQKEVYKCKTSCDSSSKQCFHGGTNPGMRVGAAERQGCNIQGEKTSISPRNTETTSRTTTEQQGNHRRGG